VASVFDVPAIFLPAVFFIWLHARPAGAFLPALVVLCPSAAWLLGQRRIFLSLLCLDGCCGLPRSLMEIFYRLLFIFLCKLAVSFVLSIVPACHCCGTHGRLHASFALDSSGSVLVLPIVKRHFYSSVVHALSCLPFLLFGSLWPTGDISLVPIFLFGESAWPSWWPLFLCLPRLAFSI
jgi:hypothetical protein